MRWLLLAGAHSCHGSAAASSEAQDSPHALRKACDVDVPLPVWRSWTIQPKGSQLRNDKAKKNSPRGTTLLRHPNDQALYSFDLPMKNGKGVMLGVT